MTSFSTLALLLYTTLLPLLSCQAATTLISTASLLPPPTARLLPPFSAALAPTKWSAWPDRVPRSTLSNRLAPRSSWCAASRLAGSKVFSKGS
ncbi:hypothetical protein DFJ73DRAFT_829822 [Zopfochytrium polystomum]|nr:hypothetical protein DFJ73DRAFT_829822 [Zopfochytrium polystomum]